MTAWWLVAVALSALSALLGSAGAVVQKLAWLRLQQRKSRVRGSKCAFRRTWVAGLGLMAAGAGPSVLALSFGSPSEIAPLGALGLVFNLWLSRIVLDEALELRDAAATTLIVCGCALSVAFSAHKDPVLDLDELLALYGRPSFVVYSVAALLALVACGAALPALDRRVVRAHGIPRTPRAERMYRAHRFLYPFAGALASAQSALLAKSLAEMVLHAAQTGDAEFLRRWEPYVMLLCLLVCVGLHLYWFNCALARFDALYVVPVSTGAGMTLSVASGGLLYGDFARFSAAQSAAFAGGVALIASGLHVLSLRADEDEREDSDDGDDTNIDLLGDHELGNAAVPLL